jgi:hypothetical protein
VVATSGFGTGEPGTIGILPERADLKARRRDRIVQAKMSKQSNEMAKRIRMRCIKDNKLRAGCAEESVGMAAAMWMIIEIPTRFLCGWFDIFS